MKKSYIAVAVLVLMSVLLSACNLGAASPTQISPDQINTIAAETVAALTTQMAPPPATATNTPEPATATPEVTETPTLAIPTINLTPIALATNTLLPLPTSAGASSCNRAFFVQDVTIPDNTVMKPGTNFVKSWKIRNDGSCTWTTAYSAVLLANNPASPVITGDASFKLKGSVAPGGFLQIDVNLFAPKEEGTYIQTWLMQDPDGKNFGLMDGSGWTVVIEVDKSGAVSTTFKTVSATTSASINCGTGEVSASGTITTNGTGNVTYSWRVFTGTEFISVAGGTYAATGTGFAQPVSLAGGLMTKAPIDGTHEVRLYINTPGGYGSDSVTCP